MELYIQWMFWMGVVGAVIRLLIMGFSSYPRVESKKSLGFDVVMFILGGGRTVWAGLLNYGAIQ